MKKLACRYSIVRFMPYPETGEFANVGIVLACPETGYFGFKLQTRRYGRITDFFSELDSRVYLESLKLFRSELDRVKSFVRENEPSVSAMRELFDALTHPREAIVKLTEARPRLLDDAEAMLDQLFRYYVEREFSTPEYREVAVAKRVKAVVDSLKLKSPFKPRTIGDDFVSAHFQFVQQTNEDVVSKVIKPFALNHDEPSKIILHGATWKDRIVRLNRKGLIPSDVLFAVDGPRQGSAKCMTAFHDMCAELSEVASVVSSSDSSRIAEFALA